MVRRLVARAELDERTALVARARESARGGDVDHAWLVDRWDAGELLLAKVTVAVHAQDSGGDAVAAYRVLEGVWLECESPPAVEEQIAQVAPAALEDVAADLRARGLRIEDAELERSFLHVELDPALRRAVDECLSRRG